MFTWICPQCGREVPPAYTECPDCSKLPAAGSGPNPPAPGPDAPPPGGYPPPPPQQQPPQYYQQPGPSQYQQAPPQYQQGPPQHAPQQYQQPQYQQPQYQQPPPQPPHAPPPGFYLPQQPHERKTMALPVWLMTIIFAVGVAGVVFAIVTLMSTNKGSGSGPNPTASVENPAAKPGAKTSPMQKYIEISGVRFTTDAKKKTLVQFVLINHSTAEISGLAGNVTVWGSTKKSEEDAQGSFSFSTNLGPMESKDLTVPFTTKLKIYELADWQNINTDIQITAPVQ